MGAGACNCERQRGREGFEQAAMDGGGGFAVELLVDDGFDESFEGRLRVGDAHDEGTGAFDELAEFGVGGGEFAAGECPVVARRFGSSGVRHAFDGIARHGSMSCEPERIRTRLVRIYKCGTCAAG